MKKILSSLFFVSLMFIGFISCKETPKKVEQSDLKLTKTSYNPGEDWKLVWADEFELDSINAGNWNYQIVEAGRFNEEWQRYTSSNKNAYIEDNCLVIKANHESDVHGMDQYTSARLNTAKKHTFKYGKIAAKIKLPYGKGIWPAFWMLGSNINENGGDTPWPQSGEIDIFELYGSKDDGIVEANAHYANSLDSHAMMGAASYKLEKGKFADDFHVFELEWDQTKISWLVDGEQYASMPITSEELSEFHKDFFILLNIAVGGTHAGRPGEETSFPQFMYIDWIRTYKK